MSIATMLGPVGVLKSIDSMIPAAEHTTARVAAQITTPRKLRHMRMADRAGKIMRADTSREPTRFIATVIITAMTVAISRLYASVRMPAACEKSLSKVTQNILL